MSDDSDPIDPPAGQLPVDAELLERVRASAALLEEVHKDIRVLAGVPKEDRLRLQAAAGRVARPGPYAKRELAREARRRHRHQRKKADEAKLARTGIRVLRAEPVFRTPGPAQPELAAPAMVDDAPEAEPVTLEEARNCYVCKADFTTLHPFYDAMCPPCAELNWQKRNQSADLEGRVALVTGGRVKIGYQAVMLLLRSGARVVVTTRFPRDAAKRFAAEADFESYRHRLDVYGLDLRHTPSVEAFCQHVASELPHLDFIINNACQTVRRPAGFYGHLLAGEGAAVSALPEAEAEVLRRYESLRTSRSLARGDGGRTAGFLDPAALSQVALTDEDRAVSEHLFPAGALDQDLQQVDLRGRNSWRLPLHEVSAVELLEVQLVNAVAPFILNGRLKPLMLRTPARDKHIVNVSAMEGQFYRRFKTDKHPHTNMAKAALNMMTRTSSADYVKDGIHMNSVDTGWVTDEDPAAIAERKQKEHGFHPPLDIVDGAARIVDPILHGQNTGEHLWGLFLKDYRPIDW